MGLVKKCRPCVFEGATHLDLLKIFAPWALSQSTTELAVSAVSCALKASANGLAELMPICKEYPLSSTCHFVGACMMEESYTAAEALMFETFYAAMGICILATVLDGDCGIHVMAMMLGIDDGFESRQQLRIELSDYLLERIEEPWMHDIMASCQELEWDDLKLLRSCATNVPPKPIATPSAVAAAIADSPVVAEVAKPDEETFEAMRWASKLADEHCILELIEALPKKVVEEQVMLYKKRDHSMVATKVQPPQQIQIGANAGFAIRMKVAQRFHCWMKEEGIDIDARLPYGAMPKFIKAHIHWTTKGKLLQTKTVKQWYTTWRASSHVVSVLAGPDEGHSLVRARNMHKKQNHMKRRNKQRQGQLWGAILMAIFALCKFT